jgi:hypothetical protein
MSYKQIQDAVLADSFVESKRIDAKNWIQFRHAWLWDVEKWTFKYATGTVTFTAGSPTAAIPPDLANVLAVYASTGYGVRGVKDVRQFFDVGNSNLGVGGGAPQIYTMVGSQMYIAPNGDGSTGIIAYEKNKPALVNDGDSTGLPDGYDLALVHGGKAEGFKLTNVPLWQGFDEDFTAAVNALRNNYLSSISEAGAQQLGAYRAVRQWS